MIMVRLAEFISVKESKQRFFGNQFLWAGKNNDYWDGLIDNRVELIWVSEINHLSFNFKIAGIQNNALAIAKI